VSLIGSLLPLLNQWWWANLSCLFNLLSSLPLSATGNCFSRVHVVWLSSFVYYTVIRKSFHTSRCGSLCSPIRERGLQGQRSGGFHPVILPTAQGPCWCLENSQNGIQDRYSLCEGTTEKYLILFLMSTVERKLMNKFPAYYSNIEECLQHSHNKKPRKE
jgi:hypothetical protein